MRVLAAAGPRLTPPSTRCIFILGQPKTIALKYPTGKNAVSGKTGKTQRMYTLTNGERAWFDLHVADAIDSLILAPGQPLTLCHHGGDIWDIDRGAVPEAPTPRSPAPQPPRYWGNEHQHAGPAAISPETDTQGPRVASVHSRMTNGAGEDTAAILARCYAQALDITLAAIEAARAKGLHILPTHEGLQACSATLFIAETRRQS